MIKYRATANGVVFEFFAKDDNDAIDIAKTLYKTEYGEQDEITVSCAPLYPSPVEIRSVSYYANEVLGYLRKTFTDISYLDFLKAFRNFEGYELNLQPQYISFMLDFMNLRCKVVWYNEKSHVDEEQILVSHKNRVYLLKGGKVYISC